MINNNKSLKEHVKEIKNVGNLLISHTFPMVGFKHEQEVLPLKQRNLVVDGYEVLLCYSKANYGNYFLESIQIQAVYSCFLPFVLVCKLGQLFLGNDNLSYIEFFREEKKIYCWTSRSKNNITFPPDPQSLQGNYEGFNFSFLQPGSIDLY